MVEKDLFHSMGICQLLLCNFVLHSPIETTPTLTCTNGYLVDGHQ